MKWKTRKTLLGEKINVYVILKILKKMFKTDLTSYILKYSVDQALEDKKYETEKNIGVSLKVVQNYSLILGEFGENSEVSDDLKKIGVEKILIKDDGIRFKFIQIQENGFHANRNESNC